MGEDDLVAEVLKKREQGEGIAQIARSLKKGNAFVTRVLKEAGQYGQPYYMSDDEKAEAIRLRRENGLSAEEIASRVGRSKYAVLEVLRKAKLNKRILRPIEVVGDIAKISLTRGRVAIIDASDLDRVRGASWFLVGPTNSKFYAASRQGGKQPTYLHRFLLDAPPDMHVDHINGDGLDNRRSNLRLATPQQNVANAKRRLGKSGFIGVQPLRQGGFFAAVQINLGTFKTAEEAARAYDAKAEELFGEFAYTNRRRGLL